MTATNNNFRVKNGLEVTNGITANSATIQTSLTFSDTSVQTFAWNTSTAVYANQIVGEIVGSATTSTLYSVNNGYTATLDDSGLLNANMFLAAEGSYGSTGFSFQNDGGFDTGMFSTGDGLVQFYANTQEVMNFDTSGLTLQKTLYVNNQTVNNVHQIDFNDETTQYTAYTGPISDQALYTTSSVAFANINVTNTATTNQITLTNISGGTPKVVTANGDAHISTAQYVYGSSSIAFSGSTNSDVSIVESSDFAFGTGDFTVETWLWANDWSGYRGIWSSGDLSAVGDFASYIQNGSSIQIFNEGVGPAIFTANFSTLSTSAWHHIALVRSSGTITAYVNGVSVGSTASSFDFKAIGNASFAGTDANGSYFFNGYVQDLRITRAAVYTGNFTPPTSLLSPVSGTVLLIAGQGANDSTTIVDSSVSPVPGQITFSDNSVQTTAYPGPTTTSTLYSVNNGHTATLNDDGNLILPNQPDAQFIIGQTAAGVVSATTSSVIYTSGEADFTTIVNGNAWTFDRAGSLQLPNGGVITDTNDYATGLNIIARGYEDNINLITVNTGTLAESTWTFSVDGNLTFPDTSVQTTAYTGPISDQALYTTSSVIFSNITATNVIQASQFRASVGASFTTGYSFYTETDQSTGIYSETEGQVSIYVYGFEQAITNFNTSTVHLYVPLTFNDNTVQTTAYTGAVFAQGSLSGGDQIITNGSDQQLLFTSQIDPLTLINGSNQFVTPTTGTYEVSVCVLWKPSATPADTDQMNIQIYAAGNSVLILQDQINVLNNKTLSGSVFVTVDTGDLISATAYTGATTSQTIQAGTSTVFTVKKIN
jgi:hypothetical protein